LRVGRRVREVLPMLPGRKAGLFVATLLVTNEKVAELPAVNADDVERE